MDTRKLEAGRLNDSGFTTIASQHRVCPDRVSELPCCDGRADGVQVAEK
jgi:hypothetical protein